MTVRPAMILAALLMPVAAMAGDTEPHTATVSYAGLNLTSAAGQQTFERRVRAAVREVCAVADGRDLKQLSARSACLKKAYPVALASMEVAIARAASRNQMVASSAAPQS